MSAPDLLPVALRFLEAYWNADARLALAQCQPDATIEYPKSASLPSAPIAEVLPIIFERIYPRFVGGKFAIAIDRTLADQSAAFIQYRASGALTNGRHFDCSYIAVLEFNAGRICRFRPYTDTKYVEAELLS
jgi:hypothetical protein